MRTWLKHKKWLIVILGQRAVLLYQYHLPFLFFYLTVAFLSYQTFLFSGPSSRDKNCSSHKKKACTNKAKIPVSSNKPIYWASESRSYLLDVAVTAVGLSLPNDEQPDEQRINGMTRAEARKAFSISYWEALFTGPLWSLIPGCCFQSLFRYLELGQERKEFKTFTSALPIQYLPREGSWICQEK